MKKWMIALCCILLVMSLTACKKAKSVPDATEAPQLTENPKTDFEYEVSKDGTGIHITKYIGTSQNVVVPAKIDDLSVISLKETLEEGGRLYKGPFAGSNVQTVVLQEGLQKIGSSAFADCSQLTQVTFPKSLRNLSGYAFENCVKLDNVDLSETQIEIIWERTFRGCTGLTQVQLPSVLTQMYSEAFADCTALKSITLPAGVKQASSRGQVFVNVPALEKIIFLEGRESINGYAFFDTTGDVEIIIPKSVKEIEPDTFFNRGTARFVFQGDCPKIKNNKNFHGNATIVYDPTTRGWDTCIWKGQHSMEPITNP